MKKLLIALFAVSLLFAPVGLMAQDPAPAVVEEVVPGDVVGEGVVAGGEVAAVFDDGRDAGDFIF